MVTSLASLRNNESANMVLPTPSISPSASVATPLYLYVLLVRLNPGKIMPVGLDPVISSAITCEAIGVNCAALQTPTRVFCTKNFKTVLV